MQEERDLSRGGRPSTLTEMGFGAIRAALLFGSAAVALALIVTPILDRSTRSQDAVVSLADSIDMTATGSVGRRANSAMTQGGGRYTIRRSVLQSSPNAVCIIRENGSRIGDC